MMDYPALIASLEQALRGGQGQQARRLLSHHCRSSRIPPPYRLPLARCSRRAGLPDLGLRLLLPKVRPSERTLPTATAEERAEYAANLVQVGAVGEGLHMLTVVSPAEVPEAGLYRAFALFTRWDYGEAVAPLLEYLERIPANSYESLVGRVNLAASYVFERNFKKARPLLRNLRKDCETQSLHRLLGNVWELLSQLAVFEGDLEEAKNTLATASRYLKQMETLDSFFVQKWETIVDGLERGKTERLLKFQEFAQKRKHWETVRDVDYFLLHIRFAPTRFHRLAMGTPYPNYLRRLEKDFSEPIPSQFAYALGPKGKPTGSFNLETGLGGTETLKAGSLSWRLSLALASDLYRPANYGRLAERIYPDEKFHPLSTPTRIRQGIKELRKWLRKTGKAKILEEEGSYRWHSDVPFELVLPREPVGSNLRQTRRNTLQKAFPALWFSRRQAEDCLEIGPRATQTLLRTETQEGHLEIQGLGPSRRYRYNRA